MAAHSPEARKVLRELNKELASAGARQGQKLVWSAQEATILAQIATLLDLKRDYLADYEASDDVKVRLGLGAEVRMTVQGVARLVRLVKTDLAPAESRTTVKARRAAVRRWDRDSNASS